MMKTQAHVNGDKEVVQAYHPMQEEITQRWKAASLRGAEEADATATQKGRRLRKKDRIFFYQVLFALDDQNQRGTDYDDNDFDSFETIKDAWEVWSGKPLRTEDEVRGSKDEEAA